MYLNKKSTFDFSPSTLKTRKILLTGIILIISVFIANVLLLTLLSPSTKESKVSTKDSLELFLTDSLSKVGMKNTEIDFVSEITFLGTQPIGDSIPGGYVNILSSDSTMLVTNTSKAPDILTLSYHESGHIAQKRLLAKQSGGYPSYFNLGQSFIYYLNIINLNNKLDSIFPSVDPNYVHNPVAFPAIETSSDCMAQVLFLRNSAKNTIGAYIVKECTPYQLATAESIIDGLWPTENNIKDRIVKFQS